MNCVSGGFFIRKRNTAVFVLMSYFDGGSCTTGTQNRRLRDKHAASGASVANTSISSWRHIPEKNKTKLDISETHWG